MAKLHNWKEKKNSNEDNAFHIVIAPVLLLAQMFGLLPITGIFSRNINNIKFKFISIRTLHTLLWFISAFVFLYLELKRMANEESTNAKTIGGIVFYCVGISSSILYVRVAYKWNDLMNLFKEVDGIFCKSPYTLNGWSLKTQIRFATVMVVIFAFCEHSLSWYSFLHDRYVQAKICHWEIENWIFYITSLHLSHIYKMFPVNTFSVVWAEYMNVSFTFAWNYVDLFIMVMSLSIATKFKMINERLEFFKGRVITDVFWDEIRCHYNKICELNDYIDDLIGSLICVACLGDIYSVCSQLLNVATPLPYKANKIYFWYSTLFLICRTFAMFLTTASVNDESVKPLAVFRTIPSDGWFQQIQRLCSQIQMNSAALSGRNFFFLTRSIIISIAGTIITYELVLLQFDGEKILPGMFNPCGERGNNSAGLHNTQN